MSKINKFQWDLLFIALLTILQIVFVIGDINSVFRVGAGFLFVAFIPGYLLMSIVLDSQRIVHISLYRLILSIPISLALSLLVGYLSYLISPKSINVVTQAFSIAALIIVLLGIALFRRRGPRIRGINNYFGFAITLILAVSISLVAFIPKAKSNSINLSILGADGSIRSIPVIVQKGTPVDLTIEVEYSGDQAQKLLLVSSFGEKTDLVLNAPQDVWSLRVKKSFNLAGVYQLKWELYTSGSVKPIRAVDIWIVVQ